MNDLISTEELSKLLNVRKCWIKSMIFKKQIPYIKIGKHIRFSIQEIEKWIEERKIKEESWN